MAIYLKDPNFIIGLRHVLVFATGIGRSQHPTRHTALMVIIIIQSTSIVVGVREGGEL